MKLKNFFLGVFLGILLLTSDTFAKRSSSGGGRRSGSSSSGGHHSSRTTSRPHIQHTTSGSIGWNVPAKSNSNPVGAPPSYDSIHKTSATNVHSSNPYNSKPSSGANYPTQPPYNPSVSGGYNNHQQQQYGGHSQNPPPYSPQNPSYGHNPPPYNPHYNTHPSNTGYNSHPSNANPYHNAPPPAYTPYNPYQSHSYSPGVGYNPPVGHAPQTVLVQSGSSRPGIGQLAKEAFVFAGVNAGVNAAVNRILPGGISGHRNDYYPPSGQQPAVNNGVVPTVTHTQITYNNYYNNGSTVPAAGEGQVAPVGGQVAPVGGQVAPVGGQVAPVGGQVASVGGQTAASSSAPPGANDPVPSVVPLTSTENINNQNSQPPSPPPTQPAPLNENQYPSPSGAIINKVDVQQFTENLFESDKNNAFKYITVQLQGQKMDDGIKDDAPEPLLVVKDEAYEIPTIRAVLALHDNYALDVKTKETPNAEKSKEENDMLDAFMETDVMKQTMKFLSDKGFLPEYEFRDALKRIWFSLFQRTAGQAGSSGFETVFLAEKFDNEIIGMHNWIYYAKQEAAKNMNYLGYIKETKLGTNGTIVKLRSTLNDIVQPVTTIFVGTSPELEMALYTMCFFVRPNVPCPIKLGGTEFIIIANAISYYGKDILISAFPEI